MRSLLMLLALSTPAFASNPYWDFAISGVPEIELFNPADPANPLQPAPPGPNPRISVQISVGEVGDVVGLDDQWLVEVFAEPDFVDKVTQVLIVPEMFRHASGELLRIHHTQYMPTDAFRDGDVGVRVTALASELPLDVINVWHLEGNTPTRLYSEDALEPTGYIPEPSTLWLALCPLMWVRRWVS